MVSLAFPTWAPVRAGSGVPQVAGRAGRLCAVYTSPLRPGWRLPGQGGSGRTAYSGGPLREWGV